MDQQVAPGVQEMNDLQAAGFNPGEIDNWRAKTTRDLQDAGFQPQEVSGYFGEKEPNMKPTEQMFASNIDKHVAAQAEKPQGQGAVEVNPEMHHAKGFIDAIEAGFDMSVIGLMHQRPDMVLPEHAPMYMRIASQVSQLAGDVPAMLAGGVIGGVAGGVAMGAAGSVVPVAGTAAGAAAGALVGSGAGAFALPEGLRTALMEHYEKGDVKDFGDFWERASAVVINSGKAALIGGATAGVGGVAGKVLGGIAAPTAIKTAAQLSTEVATMTTIGAGLEGHAPQPQNFIDAAILVAGMHGAISVAGKVRGIYAQTGVKPEEIAAKAIDDPHLQQQLLADNVQVPIGGEMGARQTPPETIPTVKPLPEPTEHSPEVQKILDNVGEKPANPKGVVNDVKNLTKSQVYTALVDKLDPINEATKTLTENTESLPAEKNPYILARTAVDAKAKAKHFFEKGVINFETKKIVSEPLRDILKDVESPETLEAYMISKRVLEKEAQGIKTGFDVEAAKAVVDQHAKQYEDAASRVTKFSNSVLDYVRDSGIISEKQHEAFMEMNKDYTPFKRILEDGEGGATVGSKNGSLKEMTGSDAKIQSPLKSTIENTIDLVKAAEANRPKTALIELANNTEGQELIKPVENKGPAVLSKNQFTVMEDGVRKVYETTPELAEAINRLGGDSVSTNLAFKIMSGITKLKKLGITFTPEFIVKNQIRDWVTGSTFSKGTKGISPLDVLSAMGDIWKKNDNYYEWLKSGGANGAFIEMGDHYISNDIYQLQKDTNFLNSVKNIAMKPLELMRVGAELSEQSLRVAEFKKVRSKGGSLTEAGYASREITIDFQRVGAKVAAMNSITSFMNVGIQGLDRTARAFAEDSTGTALKAGAFITAPSLLLWWANKDDERVKEIPRWEKDMFWIVATDKWTEVNPQEADNLPEYMVKVQGNKVFVNKGTIYRIPKPQELGLVFGSIPERVMDKYFSDNPKAMKDFDKSMLGLVTPNFVPDAIAPALEQYFNKSFFTGRDIVPHHLKEIQPEYQFVEYTSETAKQLGKMVATIDRDSDMASPMVLQNYIQSWGGSLGQYAVQLADKALVKAGAVPDIPKPADTLSDVPFVKAFVVRFPQAGSNSVQDFYDNYDKSQKTINTIKYLAKNGDFNNMEKEMQLQQNQENLVNLDGIKEGLATQAKLVRSISKDPDMSRDEKR